MRISGLKGSRKRRYASALQTEPVQQRDGSEAVGETARVEVGFDLSAVKAAGDEALCGVEAQLCDLDAAPGYEGVSVVGADAVGGEEPGQGLERGGLMAGLF